MLTLTKMGKLIWVTYLLKVLVLASCLQTSLSPPNNKMLSEKRGNIFYFMDIHSCEYIKENFSRVSIPYKQQRNEHAGFRLHPRQRGGSLCLQQVCKHSKNEIFKRKYNKSAADIIS